MTKKDLAKAKWTVSQAYTVLSTLLECGKGWGGVGGGGRWRRPCCFGEEGGGCGQSDPGL